MKIIINIVISTVVIYFHVCRLSISIDLRRCQNSRGRFNMCAYNIPSFSGQLKALCNDRVLEIHTEGEIDGDSIQVTHTGFPPLTSLWSSCRTGSLEQNFTTDTLDIVAIVSSAITKFIDGYFCDLTSTTKLKLRTCLLNDTRKLGLAPLNNCDSPCLTKLETLSAEFNVFDKVPNDSFCGLQHLLFLSLSHDKIKELESGAFTQLRSIQILDLNLNHISYLPPGVFKTQENVLKHLDLSNNQISSHSILELKNLKQLQNLYLSSNDIAIIPDGLFNQMIQLVRLNLRNNSLRSIKGTMRSLRNLEYICISRNNISAIHSEDFNYMKNLTYIDFSNNTISTIETTAFFNSQSLIHVNFSGNLLSTVPQFISKAANIKWLDLSRNNIGQIESGTFDKGEDIDSIDLSYNQLSDITNVFNNCTVRQLYLDHNRLTKLSFTEFSMNLTKLSITHNLIHTVDSGSNSMKDVVTFEHRWSIETLDLSFNQLNRLLNLTLPRSVSIFDVRDNNISFISYTADYILFTTSASNRLRQVNMENNAFQVICPDFILPVVQSTLLYHFRGNPVLCSCENQWLSPANNFGNSYLMKSIIADLSTITCQQHLQRHRQQSRWLTTIDQHSFLCSSETGCLCKPSLFNFANNLTCHVQCERCKCYTNDKTGIIHVDCSSKNITTLPLTEPIYTSPWPVIVKEFYLYLDNNLINNINSSSFKGLYSTIELYLNWTNLSEMEDDAFHQLPRLKVLHLDHNNLRHISEEIFKRLSSLRQLCLSHNQLQSVATNAFPSQLQMLYLDNNQLVDYSVWYLQNLTDLMKLSLHANSWSCECSFIEKFRTWLQTYSTILEENNQLFCLQSNFTKLQMPIITFNSSYCYNTTSINISSYDYDDMWKWLLGVFICLTITAVLAFLFRREVQVLIYSRLGVRLFYGGEKDELEGKYFDAFIAYSCVDEDFLVNILMPGLEGIDEPYKLCLHHRNFLGGASIINSIMEAVQFSTRTIILLSDNFMRSEWCRFEFQQAYIQMLKDRCNRLLVIVIDEVPADLDPEMRLYLRTNTYLKWGDRLFWKKLYFAMPERVEPRLAERRLAQLRVAQEERVIPEELPMRIMD